MRAWLLWLHLASVALLGGALAALLLMHGAVGAESPLSFGAVRQVMAMAADTLLLPSMLAMLVTGMLLLVARPTLIDARWVWAKAALGTLLALVVLLQLTPALKTATLLAVNEAASSALQTPGIARAQQTIGAALQGEAIGLWACIAMVLAAMALAVWRPGLGRRDD